MTSPLVVARLRALIDQARPDVVHAHRTGSYALLGALADRHPLVVSVDEGAAPPAGPAARRLAEFVSRRTDAVVPIQTGHNSADELGESGIWDRNGTRMLDVFARLGLHGK